MLYDQRKLYFRFEGKEYQGSIFSQYGNNGCTMYIMEVEGEKEFIHISPAAVYGADKMPEFDEYMGMANGHPSLGYSGNSVKLKPLAGFIIYDYQKEKYLSGNINFLDIRWDDDKEKASIHESEDSAKLVLHLLENIGKSFLRIESIEVEGYAIDGGSTTEGN